MDFVSRFRRFSIVDGRYHPRIATLHQLKLISNCCACAEEDMILTRINIYIMNHAYHRREMTTQPDKPFQSHTISEQQRKQRPRMPELQCWWLRYWGLSFATKKDHFNVKRSTHACKTTIACSVCARFCCIENPDGSHQYWFQKRSAMLTRYSQFRTLQQRRISSRL